MTENLLTDIPPQHLALVGQSMADKEWLMCLITSVQFKFEPWSRILESPGVIFIGKTLHQHDTRYILVICQPYVELTKLHNLKLDVVPPKEEWKVLGISLNEQDNAKTEELGEKFFMERRAFIVWKLAKAILASSSTTLIRYIWELIRDDKHLLVTFGRLVLIRDILSSKPAIRIQFLTRYYLYDVLQNINAKEDALANLITRDANTWMERLSASALATTGDLKANLETELRETRRMWHFFEASGGCSDLIQHTYGWESTIVYRIAERMQLVRVDDDHVDEEHKNESIREMILRSEIGKALDGTQVDVILAELDSIYS